MSAEGLAKALTFSWALCFVSSELRSNEAVRHELQQAVCSPNSALRRQIRFDSPSIFSQTFSFFDLNQDGVLDLPEFCSGLAKIATGSFDDWADYVFYITDVGMKGSLTRTEVIDLLFQFVHMFTSLQAAVLQMLRSTLISHNVSSEAIEDHLSSLAQAKDQAEELVYSEMEHCFSAVATGDAITLAQWKGARSYLPKLYNKLRFLCVGILVHNRPAFFEVAHQSQEANSAPQAVIGSPPAGLPRMHAPALAKSPFR